MVGLKKPNLICRYQPILENTLKRTYRRWTTGARSWCKMRHYRGDGFHFLEDCLETEKFKKRNWKISLGARWPSIFRYKSWPCGQMTHTKLWRRLLGSMNSFPIMGMLSENWFFSTLFLLNNELKIYCVFLLCSRLIGNFAVLNNNCSKEKRTEQVSVYNISHSKLRTTERITGARGVGDGCTEESLQGTGLTSLQQKITNFGGSTEAEHKVTWNIWSFLFFWHNFKAFSWNLEKLFTLPIWPLLFYSNQNTFHFLACMGQMTSKC